MGKRSKDVDAYIARAQDFAKPILAHLRDTLHRAVPEVEETIKWGMPSFVHAGGILCNFASFKEHLAVSFWKANVMEDPKKILVRQGKASMGHFGRITDLKELPSDKVLTQYFQHAAKLNEDGVKVARGRNTAPKKLVMPDFFKKALLKNAASKKGFENLSPSQQRDYATWLSEAKTEATREKRLATALEWIADGKGRNWKYEKR